MAYTLHLRAEPAPEGVILMLRAGERGLAPDKLEMDAIRSQRTIGVLGVSVVGALAGETLEEAWQRSPVTSERAIVWWSTAGRLREAGFSLLATGRDPRHYTVVLEGLNQEVLVRLAAQFTKATRT